MCTKIIKHNRIENINGDVGSSSSSSNQRLVRKWSTSHTTSEWWQQKQREERVCVCERESSVLSNRRFRVNCTAALLSLRTPIVECMHINETERIINVTYRCFAKEQKVYSSNAIKTQTFLSIYSVSALAFICFLALCRSFFHNLVSKTQREEENNGKKMQTIIHLWITNFWLKMVNNNGMFIIFFFWTFLVHFAYSMLFLLLLDARVVMWFFGSLANGRRNANKTMFFV